MVAPATVRTGPKDTGRRVRQLLSERPGRQGLREVTTRTLEAFDRNIIPKDLHLGGLAEGMLGEDWVEQLRDSRRGLYGGYGGYGEYGLYDRTMEASSLAIDPSAFTNITGQLLVRLVREGYQNPQFIAQELAEVVSEPASAAVLGELKEIGYSDVIDEPPLIEPGKPYPQTELREDWVIYPGIKRYGQHIALSIEALAGDRTGGQLQKKARDLGFQAGLRREKEILRLVMGLTNTHNWKGTVYNTYLTSGGWINSRASIDTTTGTFTGEKLFEQQMLFTKINNPYTLNPVQIDYSQMKLLHMPEAGYSFNVAVGAVTVRSGQISNAPAVQGEAPSPLTRPSGMLTSPYAYQVLRASGVSESNARHYWWLGQFQHAFIYREWLKPDVFVAPPGNDDEFMREVLLKVKAVEAGGGGVRDPRYTSQCKNS